MKTETEKEILSYFSDGWEFEGEDITRYFKRHRQHLETFAKYIEKGKQMDKNRILYKLSDLYLSGFFPNVSTPEADFEVEADFAYSCITAVFEQLSANVGEYREKTKNYGEILHNLNPKFPADIDSYQVVNEDAFLSFLEYFQFCFETLIPEHKDDEEMCIAACTGLYWQIVSPGYEFDFD